MGSELFFFPAAPFKHELPKLSKAFSLPILEPKLEPARRYSSCPNQPSPLKDVTDPRDVALRASRSSPLGGTYDAVETTSVHAKYT